MAAHATADDDVARLLQVLLALEADVSFRCLVSRLRCTELERVLAYVARARQARARAHEAAQQRHAVAQTEARRLERSISDAIRRARRIRLQLAETPCNDEDEDDEGDSDQEETSELAGILAQARTIRAVDGETTDKGRDATVQEEAGSDERQTSPVPTRIEYPRRMKTLLDTLAEYEADEAAQSFRTAFCRKMTEHIAMRESMARNAKEGRVQVGYVRQVERLGLAYRRLGEYLKIKGNVDAPAVQRALQAPSISTVYPVFCRLKIARAQLGQLHDLTKRLAPRLPVRPSLSHAAMTHRNAMLERFRKKAPTPREAVATATNRLLLAGPSGNNAFAAHQPLLEKLQLAWGQNATVSAYTNAVGETILSEMSNLVLSAFQTAYCDGTSTPSPTTVRELLGVIRVAESAVVHKARRQRSAVQR